MGPEDELYALPLDGFTAARNELAKQLRREGEKERADEVRALAKPTVAAWTVNQLARRRPAQLGALLEAGDALRAAALRGAGGDELREATRRERELVAELRREARSLLEESGRPAGDALLERVAATLSNAARDPDVRPLLEAGRLTEEVEARGFDAYEGVTLPAAQPARPKAAEPERDEAAERRRAAEERKRAAELRRRAAALERVALAAEREAARAAEAAAEAADAASRARRAADEARAEADFVAQSH